MANIIREYKRHYNKLDQVFECDRIHLDSSLAVLRYVTDREYRVAGQVTETGSTTLAVYEQGNRTVFWKMLRPDGSFQGYLVHLCEPIEIRPGSVSYRDLMLDVWMGQDGELELLDEDDLRDALAAGQISTEAAAVIQRNRIATSSALP